MEDEIGLNLIFFDENNVGSKDINKEYKKTLEKEEYIKTGECYLNYLFSNDYMKPFIKKDYEIKTDKNKSYLEKMNIYNYKAIFNDLLNKKKKHFLVTVENESIKRILNILDNKHSSNNKSFKNRNQRYNHLSYNKYFHNIDNSNTNTNKKKDLHITYNQNLLPKINLNLQDENITSKENINRFSNGRQITDIFRTTSCIKDIRNPIRFKSQIEDNNTRNNLINFYSPNLKKNMFHIFKKMDDKEYQSVNKSRYINYGINKITSTKFNIDSYDFQKNKFLIKKKSINGRNNCLIDLFNDIGKVKGTHEIEKTLFNDNKNKLFTKLKIDLAKKGIKRINRNMKSLDD